MVQLWDGGGHFRTMLKVYGNALHMYPVIWLAARLLRLGLGHGAGVHLQTYTTIISIKTENSHFGKLSRPASPSLSCFDLWLLFSNRTLLPIQLAAQALLSRSVISTRHRSSSLTGFLFPLPLLWLCGDTDSTATDTIDQPHPAVYLSTTKPVFLRYGLLVGDIVALCIVMV